MRKRHTRSFYSRLWQAFFLLFTLTFFSVTPVRADVRDLESLFDLDLKELALIEVTTASRSPEALIDAPAKVVLITKQQIHERGYINLFDLLRGQVGFDTHAYSHETTYNRIAIRGVEGNSKFIIQQNGFPISSPAGDPMAIADNFPLFNAERVEIVYGPASALYGADAFTGIINIVTDTGKVAPGTFGTYVGEDSVRYLYGYSDYELGDNVRFSFAGHTHQAHNPDLSDPYRKRFVLEDLVDFGGNTVVPAAQRAGYYGRTKSNSLLLRLHLGDDFTAGYYRSLFDSPTTTGLLPNSVDYGSRASWSSLVGNVYCNYGFDINRKTSARIRASYAYYEVDSSSRFNNIFSNFSDGYKYARADKSQFDGQFNYEWDKNNKIIFGVVAERLSALPKTADLTRPYDPDRTSEEQLLYYGGTSESLKVKIFDTTYHNLGAYAQYRRSWHEQFDSIIGMRYDDNSRYGSSLNPRIGIIYKHNQRLTAKLLYGEAFLAPAPEFTYEHFGAFSGAQNAGGDYTSSFFFIPNTDLKPEEMKTAEANFSYLYSSRLSFGLSLYYSKVDKLILNTAMAQPDSDFIDSGFIAATSHNDNIGNLEVTGADFDFAYVDSFNASVLKFWGNYSYTDGELNDRVRNLKVDLPFVSRHKVKLGLTYSYRNKYYVTPHLYWIDDTSTDVVDIVVGGITSKKARSYTLVGLNAGIDHMGPGLSLSLRIENLFDRRYYNAGTGVNITFDESPQNPRQVTLGLNYQF